MYRETLDGFNDFSRLDHYVSTLLSLALSTDGSYIRIGGIRIETEDDARNTQKSDMFSSLDEGFEISFFDPERARETTISVERFVVKKRMIFGDKIAYRLGFAVDIGDIGEHKGYLVGESLSDVLARSLKTMSRNFEDPLFDEQSSLLAMQRS
jgi:hypothetical protein